MAFDFTQGWAKYHRLDKYNPLKYVACLRVIIKQTQYKFFWRMSF